MTIEGGRILFQTSVLSYNQLRSAVLGLAWVALESQIAYTLNSYNSSLMDKTGARGSLLSGGPGTSNWWIRYNTIRQRFRCFSLCWWINDPIVCWILVLQLSRTGAFLTFIHPQNRVPLDIDVTAISEYWTAGVVRFLRPCLYGK